MDRMDEEELLQQRYTMQEQEQLSPCASSNAEESSVLSKLKEELGQVQLLQLHELPEEDEEGSKSSRNHEQEVLEQQLQQEKEAGEADEEDDHFDKEEWQKKAKHVFVLSQAGKPIYSRYGSEDKLVTLFGVMQALVSFVQMEQDSIKSIHAGGCTFLFLVKGPLILVSVSKTWEQEQELALQLNYVFNQIVSVVTLTQLNRVFEQRRNYDFRRLLGGSERLIEHLLTFTEKEPAFLLGSVKCLPLAPSVRETINQAVIQTCGKIRNLVFSIMIANNQLISLVKMKKYLMHPSDLHLIFNLVNSSESFKTAESWTPICLPKFDSSGYLHAHVSYLAEDCQACLLLLTVDRDEFFTLYEAKKKIVEKLRRSSNCLQAINEAMTSEGQPAAVVGVPQLRHYLYKCKATAQYHEPALQPPYLHKSQVVRLYRAAQRSLHARARPLKLAFHRTSQESVLAYSAKEFDCYAIFEPLADIATIIDAVSRLLKWIEREEEVLFITNSHTF